MKYLFLLAIIFSTSLLAVTNQLTLHVRPSPEGMDWSSPKTLAYSALMNRISGEKRFIGHVFVELECADKRELIGMSSEKFDYLNQLLWENRGLGIFWHSFPGRLETKEELEPELKDLQNQGKVSFTRFLLNEKQCKRLTTYLSEYRTNNVGRHYGLAHRPLYAEGAGCSAFGVSFLEVAGILGADMREAWINYANVPMEYAGPPVKDDGVSFIKLALFGEWAPENMPHKKIVFWDPEKMDKWVKDKLTHLPHDMKPANIGKAVGVVKDMSLWPAPEGNIWSREAEAPVKK